MASVDKVFHLAFADFRVELSAGVHTVGLHVVEFALQIDYFLQAFLVFILLADVHHDEGCEAEDVEYVASEEVECEKTATM